MLRSILVGLFNFLGLHTHALIVQKEEPVEMHQGNYSEMSNKKALPIFRRTHTGSDLLQTGTQPLSNTGDTHNAGISSDLPMVDGDPNRPFAPDLQDPEEDTPEEYVNAWWHGEGEGAQTCHDPEGRSISMCECFKEGRGGQLWDCNMFEQWQLLSGIQNHITHCFMQAKEVFQCIFHYSPVSLHGVIPGDFWSNFFHGLIGMDTVAHVEFFHDSGGCTGVPFFVAEYPELWAGSVMDIDTCYNVRYMKCDDHEQTRTQCEQFFEHTMKQAMCICSQDQRLTCHLYEVGATCLGPNLDYACDQRSQAECDSTRAEEQECVHVGDAEFVEGISLPECVWRDNSLDTYHDRFDCEAAHMVEYFGGGLQQSFGSVSKNFYSSHCSRNDAEHWHEVHANIAAAAAAATTGATATTATTEAGDAATDTAPGAATADTTATTDTAATTDTSGTTGTTGTR